MEKIIILASLTEYKYIGNNILTRKVERKE